MATQSFKHNVLVVGAGRLGSAIIRRLLASENYAVSVADPSYETLQKYRSLGLEGLEPNGTQYRSVLGNTLKRMSAVICAAPHFVAPEVAKVAKESGCHYLDVSESLATRAQIAELAEGAQSAFVSGCGLAPGYINALAAEAVREAGPGDEVAVYVGAVPQQKVNRLGYGNMWGIDGLMSEYTSVCRAVRDGRIVDLPPLSELEELHFKGMRFEAFTTAGSLDDLLPSSVDRVSGLLFKTIRYPGHLDYMQFLIDDMGLGSRPSTLKNMLLNGLPKVDSDQLIIRVETRKGGAAAPQAERQVRNRRELHLTSRKLADGQTEGSVAIASAEHVCSVMDLLCREKLKLRGPVSHSEIRLSELLESRFVESLRQG